METDSGEGSVEAVEGVHLTKLVVGDDVSVQRGVVEAGAAVPEHSHPHEQVGYVVEGTLTFVLEDGEERAVSAGESFALAGGEPHAAENRTEGRVVAIDVFSPPRTEADWQE
jgi:quercetin dioxygenase-like cupin family protein